MNFQIANRKIGLDQKPFIIAEISGNHDQSLDRALQLVDVAADAGADAVKLQTYTADTMTLKLSEREFWIHDPQSLWSGSSLYDLYTKAHTPWEWHPAIFEHCKKRGLLGFSTPFDASAVDFLESLNVPAYKIASFENTDLPLIRRVARTGKPMIISTGMASLSEIEDACQAAREAGCSALTLLKCTSSYPAQLTDSHLKTIPELRSLFNVEVGLSDHTLGIGAAIASIALGASVIEKHITLSKDDGAVDSKFSLEPAELKLLVTESCRAHEALGKVQFGPSETERKSLQYRRSIYITEDLGSGEVLTEKNIRCIRPGLGLSPKYYEQLLGKRVNRPIPKGTPASWDILG